MIPAAARQHAQAASQTVDRACGVAFGEDEHGVALVCHLAGDAVLAPQRIGESVAGDVGACGADGQTAGVERGEIPFGERGENRVRTDVFAHFAADEAMMG